MINVKQAKWYCCEDISKIYGYSEAIADKVNMWECHHCLGLAYSTKQLKEKGLYYKQPAEMLMFVKQSDHKMLHGLTFKTSDTARKNLSLSHINNPKLSKSVIQLTRHCDVVAEYPSASEASRMTCIRKNHIIECCNGKRKTAGGYCWRFAE